MPKLRRLTGPEVIRILEQFGFIVSRTKGSHRRLKRVIDDAEQYLTVAFHGNKPIPIGTLRKIYREACEYIPEEELEPHFNG
jgi:predicted RNA binding protein YcfA (HicA-like mRNA interferase family)